MEIPKRLHRYTSIKNLMELIKLNKLTLVNPEKWLSLSWSDKNDALNLQLYEKQKKTNIYALCFTQEEESHFYWDSVGGGSVECRITFDGQMLIEKLNNSGVRWGLINYFKIPELKKVIQDKKLQLNDVPFVKRWPYRQEKEFRIIWEGKKQKDSIKIITVDHDAVKSIAINDRISDEKFNAIKEEIKSIKNFKPDRLSRVTVHQNSLWLKYLQEGISNLR